MLGVVDIVIGWISTTEGCVAQFRLLHDLTLVGKSVLLYGYDATRAFGQRKVIDIRWVGRNANGALALVLAPIIRQHSQWRQSTIRMMVTATPKNTN